MLDKERVNRQLGANEASVKTAAVTVMKAEQGNPHSGSRYTSTKQMADNLATAPPLGRLFLRNWVRFAFEDAAGAAFGWGTIPATALLVVAGRLWGFKMPSDPGVNQVVIFALAATGVAWLVAFLANLLLFAPVKAYRLINPFVLSIDDQYRPPDFTANDKMIGYKDDWDDSRHRRLGGAPMDTPSYVEIMFRIRRTRPPRR
jgi:hypothetical protein